MDLPDIWKRGALKEVCLPTFQWNPSKEKRERFTYIDVSAVSRDSCAIQQPQVVSAKEAPSRARKIVRTGDSLYATVRPTLRRIAFVDHDYNNQIASTAFCVLRPNTNEVAPRFLYFLLQTDFINDEITKHESGASYPAVNDKHVLNCEAPLPPKPEQEKIAAVLWKVQKAIEIQDKLVRTTRELKAAAMRRLFTRGLRDEPLKQTEIGPVPESWEVRRLENCCEVVTSSISYTDFMALDDATEGEVLPAMGIKVSDMNLPGNETVITRANLGKCVARALAEQKFVPPRTIVFPKRGAAIATNKKRMTSAWTVLDPNLIGVLPLKDLDSDFLFYWFQQFDLRTITEPGPTPQLNKKNLTPLLLPVPNDADEQREIAQILQTLDRKIALHEKKRAALQDLFKTLLHQLMTARIRVHELDIDTSEVEAC